MAKSTTDYVDHANRAERGCVVADMSWEDDFKNPPVVPKDSRTLDLFGIAEYPPQTGHLLDRCKSGCSFVNNAERCSKCHHPYAR